MKDGRSAIWGGGTLGLIVGLILTIIRGDTIIIIYSIIIGIIVGVIAEVLGWISDRLKK